MNDTLPKPRKAIAASYAEDAALPTHEWTVGSTICGGDKYPAIMCDGKVIWYTCLSSDRNELRRLCKAINTALAAKEKECADVVAKAVAIERGAGETNTPPDKPQEWTAKDGCLYHGERRWPMEYRQSAQEVADEIKATIADEREKVVASSALGVTEQKLANQLDAEKKRCASTVKHVALLLRETQEQLAAEREIKANTERKYLDMERRHRESERQLAAEREKVQTLVDALLKLRENQKRGQKPIIDAALAKVGK